MNIGPLQFVVRGLRRGDGTAVVRRVDGGGPVDDGETDYAEYAVHFRPPVARSRASSVHVAVSYRGSARVASRELFGRFVCPEEKAERVTVGELEYLSYETHQVRIEAAEEEPLVCSLYLRIENATCGPDPRYDLLLRGAVDVGLRVLPALVGDSLRGLSWFPPDVDPAQWGLRIDPRTIPQRTALWFALRGRLSGSKAYKALGFFLPREATSLDASGSFTAAARMRMRTGTHAEPEAVLMYSLAYPQRTLEELGWCPASAPYPVSWGASPDMGAKDPHAEPPAEIRAQWPDADFTRGVLEIKTSTTKLSMEDYFYPQVYMEMIALGAYWADVVRFRPERPRGQPAQDTIHVYRVWRDRAMEERLVGLWRRALTNESILGRTVQEPEFQEARRHCAHLARDATDAPSEVLSATPAYQEALQEYLQHKSRLHDVVRAPDDMLGPPVEAELYERSLEIAHAVKRQAGRAELAALVAHQVAALGK